MKKEFITNIVRDKKNLCLIGMALVLLVVLGKYALGGGGDYYESPRGYAAGFDMEMAMAEPMIASKHNSRAMVADASDIVPSPGEEAAYDGSVERKLITNGSLSITVQNIPEARESINRLVTVHKGFVANENFSDREYYDEYGSRQSTGKSGYMTLKVPQGSFAEVMDEIRELALVVTNENSNVQDVTERYTDLETRLTNKKREEEQYRSILRQARKISDILEVTRYLEQARGEVERLQGQLNVLSNQIDLSTIIVNLESEQTVVFGAVTWNPGQEFTRAWNDLVQGLIHFANNMIAWALYVPVILLYVAVYGGIAGLLFVLGRKMYQKVRNGGSVAEHSESR